jgi:hypothetical protein
MTRESCRRSCVKSVAIACAMVLMTVLMIVGGPLAIRRAHAAHIGDDLYYPSIGVTTKGRALMVFSLSGPTLFPSAAYFPLSMGGTTQIHILKAGAVRTTTSAVIQSSRAPLSHAGVTIAPTTLKSVTSGSIAKPPELPARGQPDC